jgi:hypothetical protein
LSIVDHSGKVVKLPQILFIVILPNVVIAQQATTGRIVESTNGGLTDFRDRISPISVGGGRSDYCHKEKEEEGEGYHYDIVLLLCSERY